MGRGSGLGLRDVWAYSGGTSERCGMDEHEGGIETLQGAEG